MTDINPNSRYRLPDYLGGHPVIVDWVDANYGRRTAKVRFHVPDVGDQTITLDARVLVETKPPLPPEPPNGFIGVGNGKDDLYQRDDESESLGRSKPGHHWWQPGTAGALTWEEVVKALDGKPLVELQSRFGAHYADAVKLLDEAWQYICDNYDGTDQLADWHKRMIAWSEQHSLKEDPA